MTQRVERQLIVGALHRVETLFMEIVESSDPVLLSRAWERGSEGANVRSVYEASPHGDRGSPGADAVVVRRVWWQKPDCLRDEVFFGSELLAVNVCRGASAASYDPRHGILYTNDPSVRGPRPPARKRVPNPTLPTIRSEVEQITLLHPPFGDPGWEVTVADGEGQFAGRPTLSITARRSDPRTSRAGWQWDGLDRFTAVVDQQLGLPFQIAAMVDGEEAAVFSARAFRIDEPVPAHVFYLEPPRRAFVALVHPHA